MGNSDVARDTADRHPLKVFISYSSKDDAHRSTLDIYLKPLERDGLVDVWHDRKIEAGEEWNDAISKKLNASDVIILLVSQHFLASDFCYKLEMSRALERHDASEARVIPIILNECNWERAPFARLQVLPDRAKPVNKFGKKEAAWTMVTKAIQKLAMGEEPVQHGGATLNSLHAPGALSADPALYLKWVRDSHSHLDMRGMGAQVAERLELSRVYTRLSVSAPTRDPNGREMPEGKNSRPAARDGDDLTLRQDTHRELHEILGEHPHAAVVGDPGSGKTTFLRFVAQNLARAQLGDSEAMERIGLMGTSPFPIFVRLAEMAKWLREHPNTSIADQAPQHFYRYLDFTLQGTSHDLPDGYLRNRLLKGGCFLLLDGLDEVPGSAMRLRLARLIEEVVITGAGRGNRHLITCRTRAYQGLVQLSGLVATLRLAPFGDGEVHQFVQSWSRALLDRGETSVPTLRAQADAYRDELLAEIKKNPSRRTFSASPLMLTVLAVVYWSQKKLPEQRAELYHAAVTYLLSTRSEQLRAEHPERTDQLRRECLQAVAIRMFEHSEGVQKTLDRAEAVEAVQAVLAVSIEEATAFLEDEELHSGLLVSRSEGEVEFWHLTFQEYLAALELSPVDEESWTQLKPHLFDDRWTEVVLLLAGCERRGGPRLAKALVARVLTTGTDTVTRARAVGLVGRMLRDIKPYGGDPASGTAYLPDLQATLAIFEADCLDVAESIRIEVGEALGQSGDPRLDKPLANRVLIPGGTFWMGAQAHDPKGHGYDDEAFEDEEPVHKVTVSALMIGRYLVTAAEFARFVDAGSDGYLRENLWDMRGWEWREGTKRTGPAGWDNQRLHPNRPVVGASWYEADAYCRWNGGRLPTEAEWEWVARGSAGRKYPWGAAAPTDRHANFDRRLGVPTPVGIYPADVHEYGIRDLAGNVWEWCGDPFAPYSEREPTPCSETTTGSSLALRGGSFVNDARGLRGGCRISYYRVNGSADVGFRVVWSVEGGAA